MRPILIAASLLALAPIAAPAQAPMTVPGAHDRARAVAGDYAVDTGHTQVLFTVLHLGFSEYTGQFTQPTGSLTLDPAHPNAAKFEIVFPIDKVSTTVPALDTHLKSPDFFDAAKFPDARFVSTSVKATGDTATIVGNLTLKGVTRPVTLAARFVGAGPGMMDKKANIGFAATTTIKRSDFGLGYGVPMVSDEVKIVINAAFTQR